MRRRRGRQQYVSLLLLFLVLCLTCLTCKAVNATTEGGHDPEVHSEDDSNQKDDRDDWLADNNEEEEEEEQQIEEDQVNPYPIMVVSTKLGLISSDEPRVQDDGTAVLFFKGIPYAKPPVKDLRWKAPEPAEPWEGVRNGSTYSSLCPQAMRECE